MIRLGQQLFKRAKEHQGLKLYGANMSWLFAEKIFRMAIGFTVGIYVAYKLGPANYGLLNYAVGLAMIFSIFVALGLDQILIRELVKRPEERDSLMGTALLLRLAGWVLMVISVLFGLQLMNCDSKTRLLVMIIVCGYIFQTLQTIDYYFQAKVQSKYIAISQIVAWTIISSLRLVFAWRGFELVYFAILEAANIALMSLGYLIFYCFKAASPLKWRASLKTAVYFLSRSWKLILSSLAIMVYMRIDQVMIKEMLGNNSAGQYALAIRFCEMWYIIPGILASTFFPSIIRAKEISGEHYHHRLQLFFVLMSWLSIAIAGALTVLSPLLAIFMPQYSDSSRIIMIYAWVLPFVFWAAVNGAWQIAESQFTLALILPLVNSVLNVALNYFLIRKIGIGGAAFATIISYFITTIIIQLAIPKTRILVIMTLESLFPIFLLKKLSNHET